MRKDGATNHSSTLFLPQGQAQVVELQEEIRDLLLVDAQAGQSVHIREVPGGGICLAGATEKEVGSKSQMAELLSQGTLQRATASTNMNKHSSRSHAIFTITVEQRRQLLAKKAERGVNEEACSAQQIPDCTEHLFRQDTLPSLHT